MTQKRKERNKEGRGEPTNKTNVTKEERNISASYNNNILNHNRKLRHYSETENEDT